VGFGMSPLRSQLLNNQVINDRNVLYGV